MFRPIFQDLDTLTDEGNAVNEESTEVHGTETVLPCSKLEIGNSIFGGIEYPKGGSCASDRPKAEAWNSYGLGTGISERSLWCVNVRLRRANEATEDIQVTHSRNT
jgi:hypothetical protein